MAYKLLALDLDGTVMDHDLVITPKVSTAIAAVRAQGIRVTLATGRMYASTVPYARTLAITEPLICYQGAMVRHPISGEIYHHVAMPPAAAAEAVQLLLDARVLTIAYINEQLWVPWDGPDLEEYLRWHPEGVDVIVEPNLAAAAAATPPTKLLFVAQPEIVERELLRLAPRFSGVLSALRSHVSFGELTAPGISKGAALERLAQQMGIAREEVVAIGDQENDVSMIKWAGLGLAMANGIPEAHAAAAAVVPPVSEGGVAWAIEKYLLQRTF